MENLSQMFSTMSISQEEVFLASGIVMEMPSAVKILCDLMNAMFYEVIAFEVSKLSKKGVRVVKWTTGASVV